VIRFFTFVIAVLLSVGLWAQAPQSFSYQAVIRGTNNSLVVNKPVGIKVSLLQGSENGTAIYVETHKPTSNENGLVSIAIGGGNKDASSNAFTSIDWSKGPYFIKTETDPTGGTSYSLNNVSQLLSVPYAIHSKTAESLVGGNSGSNSGSFSHFIGEEFGGGVIFHLWKDAKGLEHGLVVDKTDLSTNQVWSNVTNVEIGVTARSSWDGLSNSNAIVNQSGHTSSAASLCLNSTNGGQTDWYLPSIQELNMLWSNFYTVARTLSKIVGSTQITDTYYWSSTETSSADRAWRYSFNNGDNSTFTNKDYDSFVRAIRAF